MLVDSGCLFFFFFFFSLSLSLSKSIMIVKEESRKKNRKNRKKKKKKKKKREKRTQKCTFTHVMSSHVVSHLLISCHVMFYHINSTAPLRSASRTAE